MAVRRKQKVENIEIPAAAELSPTVTEQQPTSVAPATEPTTPAPAEKHKRYSGFLNVGDTLPSTELLNTKFGTYLMDAQGSIYQISISQKTGNIYIGICTPEFAAQVRRWAGIK